ncbi:MAG: ferrochelatase [Opitutaceae bacterium]|jgi:ferrochelatase|nr:ferrochelatase [Opitutaceae bacterium]
MSSPKRAVLLVNLGSPDSTDVPDVKKYLREFLGDERVIDLRPRWAAKFLVNCIIAPTRAPKSAEAYKEVWKPEGSPLIITSMSVQKKLVAALGPDLPVFLAMRYGTPSIASVLQAIAAAGIEELLLIPQYPHYAMSSWETVVVKVYEEAKLHAPATRIDCVQPFYEDADYIEALHEVSRPHLDQAPYDHVLFSYHGIPERHLRKADSSKGHCMITPNCCDTCSAAHATCYKAQCVKTTQAFVRRAGIPDGKWSISFQSRIAGEPWLSPYTDHEFQRLPKEGKKRLVVFTPAFVADCLETLEEIEGEGKEDFLQAGGEHFHHVPCLNDSSAYIEFLRARARRWAEGEKPTATQRAAAAATFARKQA